MILTLVPVNEEPNEEHPMEPSVSSTSEVSLKMPGSSSKGMTTRIAQFALPQLWDAQGKDFSFLPFDCTTPILNFTLITCGKSSQTPTSQLLSTMPCF